MCGIVGYVGAHNASDYLLDGLKRLEYRGYDSAGMAVLTTDGYRLTRKTGRVSNLATAVQSEPMFGRIGISHTRWATHGGVTEANAHPHISSDGMFAIVHNGVIENYVNMKNFLLQKGYTFSSQTDTEALINLIAYHYAKEPENNGKNRFVESVRKALLHVQGTYGIAVLCKEHPSEIVAARKGSPLIIGLGDNENLIASDASALALKTSRVIYLKDGELALVSDRSHRVITTDDETVQTVVHEIEIGLEEYELGDFRHYMEKEIFEQPTALQNAMRGRFSDDSSTARFGGLNIDPHELRQIDRILLCACGTAWHACLVTEYLIEKYARIPVEVEYASEFRYRNSPLDKNTLVVVISQSGETIDTLAALREAKRKGFKVMAITNVVGSTIAREVDGGVYQHAGPEIGVASTKAFTSQVLIGAMIALYLGRLRDMSYSDGVAFVEALKMTPDLVSEVLNMSDQIHAIAKRYAHYEDFLFLGRQNMFPIALEGALKLKEISYVHAEGYPAAEMKHGPIALVSEKCPSLFLVTDGEIFAKTLSNIQEVKARKGKVIVIASDCCEFPEGLVDELIQIPSCHDAIQPVLASIPVQLLSYYIAVERGCDVDKPRNLAKSVTVE